MKNLIKETEKDIALMKYEHPESTEHTHHSEKTLEDWMAAHVMSNVIVGRNSEAYWNDFIRMLDYLANPSIIKKNSILIDNFLQIQLQYFLDSGLGRLEHLKKKISKHVAECYTTTGETDKALDLFFWNENSTILERFLYVHKAGSKDKISEEIFMKKKTRNEIENNVFDNLYFVH